MVIWVIIGITWCVYVCMFVRARKCGSCGKLRKRSVHMYLHVSISCHLNGTLCGFVLLQLIYDTVYNRMPAWGEQMWTLHGVSESACVYMCVQQMSCVLFCSPDWLVFVAAPSCRWAWPRASLSARTSHASAALICQLLRPSPAPNTTHSLPGSAPSLDDAVLLTHTYHAPFFSLTHTCSVFCCATNTTCKNWAEEHHFVPACKISLPLIFSLTLNVFSLPLLPYRDNSHFSAETPLKECS